MHMQSALKPLPLAHGETPPETVVPKTRSPSKSTPSTAMHMQLALKPLLLAHGETPPETVVPKTRSPPKHAVDGHADAVGAEAAASRPRRDDA